MQLIITLGCLILYAIILCAILFAALLSRSIFAIGCVILCAILSVILFFYNSSRRKDLLHRSVEYNTEHIYDGNHVHIQDLQKQLEELRTQKQDIQTKIEVEKTRKNELNSWLGRAT